VFIDESGFLMAPHLRRSWAPRGVTPLLYQRGRSWGKVSAIAALLVPPGRDDVACVFRLHRDANIIADHVLSFLRELASHLSGTSFFVIWDRWQPHRERRVRSFLATSPAVGSAFLPAYAPELNPVEYLWGYLKTNHLANLPSLDSTALVTTTRRLARSVQRRRALLRSFIDHSPLSLHLR
jgi:hypothetical protein